jgi:hypothetical protein
VRSGQEMECNVSYIIISKSKHIRAESRKSDRECVYKEAYAVAVKFVNEVLSAMLSNEAHLVRWPFATVLRAGSDRTEQLEYSSQRAGGQ